MTATEPQGGWAELAAEYALGVLDGAELARARALELSDRGFRSEVETWSLRLGPLLDDVSPVEPPAGLWSRIAESLPPANEGGNVVALRQRVNRWRTATGAASAIAASLALLLVARPGQVAVPPPPPTAVATAPPMVAVLGAKTAGLHLMASWTPAGRTLVLAASADMPVATGHAHELWVIPVGGKPRSLGTMPSGRHMVMHVPERLSNDLRDGATLAVSLEPAGGSPTGLPTGPVLVSGPLQNA